MQCGATPLKSGFLEPSIRTCLAVVRRCEQRGTLVRRPVQSTPPLLTIRSALVLGLSLIFGTVAGVLTYSATSSVPGAILGAGAATAGAIGLLNQIISDPADDSSRR